MSCLPRTLPNLMMRGESFDIAVLKSILRIQIQQA